MTDNPRILIVDDEPRMAESVAAVLKASGHDDVRILNDAPAAVAHINSGSYDLVLLDVNMPGMSGFELLDAIDRSGITTAFIVMTGDASMESAVEALRKGATDYVRKPCDPDELIARVAKAVEHKQLADRHNEVEAEKRHLEFQLRQSQKMEAIGTLAGGVAHDFNNILGIIVGNTEVARLIIAKDHDAQDNLDKVLLASMRARDLINQLLSFSRQSESAWKPLELNSLITECLTLMRASIPSNIEFRHETAASSYFVEGDATQIHQIIINLCTNAAHAMESHGGRLEVTLQSTTAEASGDPDLAPGNYIRLRVADNGSGIDPEIQERIFEPYFTTKEQGRGTGMGLAVVHGIVRNHGGDIKVHSEVGKGTAFDIFLPLRESRAGSTKTQVAHDAPSGTERILVVDDEAMIAEVMKRILEQLGYCVSSFTSSEEAFEHFASDPYNYDLVVTDMTMPGMTGDVLAERVNAIRPELPLILCSGYNEHLSYERLKRFGVREFVKKPAGVQVWAEAIRRAIDESPADRRRDKRFPVKRGAFVIFRSQATERGRVLDVSMSGLAFRYDDDEGLPDLNDELSIVSPNDGFVVDHVSYETVSDVDANDTGRRRGIRFGNLSPVQLERLGAFIRDYAMEPSQA